MGKGTNRLPSSHKLPGRQNGREGYHILNTVYSFNFPLDQRAKSDFEISMFFMVLCCLQKYIDLPHENNTLMTLTVTALEL